MHQAIIYRKTIMHVKSMGDKCRNELNEDSIGKHVLEEQILERFCSIIQMMKINIITYQEINA